MSGIVCIEYLRGLRERPTSPSGLPIRLTPARNRAMPNDGLRKLPDHVVAPLLRADVHSAHAG